MSEFTVTSSSAFKSRLQNQMQWLNWKCDELYRKIEDCEKSTNVVRKASASLLKQELQQLQAIGQTLEQVGELSRILKGFTQ